MAIKISGSTIIDDDRNIVNAGVVTATAFSGDGSNLTGVGVGSTGNVSTTGIIDASGYDVSGVTVIDGNRNINAGVGTFTNLNVTPNALTFSPTDESTNVSLTSNIVITYSQLIQKGSGNITLRSDSASGTIIETISVSSGNVTISGSEVTIDPVNVFSVDTIIYVVIDAGAFTSINFTSPTQLLNTYNFRSIPFTLSSVTPTNGATGIAITTNITLAFNNPPTRGTGTITLRSGSASGSILESFDANSSGRISISVNDWILDPTSSLPYNTAIFLVLPNTAINGFAGLNVVGGTTHSFTSRALAPGDASDGGFIICQSAGTRWIIAPSSTEQCLTWYARSGNPGYAQGITGCTGWFLPSLSQMQNPGALCAQFWDAYTTGTYWSNTVINGNSGCSTNIPGGGASMGFGHTQYRTRSMRTVSY